VLDELVQRVANSDHKDIASRVLMVRSVDGEIIGFAKWLGSVE